MGHAPSRPPSPQLKSPAPPQPQVPHSPPKPLECEALLPACLLAACWLGRPRTLQRQGKSMGHA